MKKILFLFLVFLSIKSIGQDVYDAQVSFNMTDSTDDFGSVYKRKAFLNSFNYNQDKKTLEIFVRVRFFNGATELKKFAQSYIRSFYISNDVFVVSATGAIVGDKKTMRSLYGTIEYPQTDSARWMQSVYGGDSLTTPCIGQYDYISKLFDGTNKANNVIKNLCQRAALEGKLN